MAGADGLPPVLSRADDRWVKTLPAVTTHPVASYFTDAAAFGEELSGRPMVIWGARPA